MSEQAGKLFSEIERVLACQHEFDEYDSNLNGTDAECVHGCGAVAGDVFPE